MKGSTQLPSRLALHPVLWLLAGVVALTASNRGFDLRLIAVGLFGLAALWSLKGSLKGSLDEFEPAPQAGSQADSPQLTSRPAK